MNTLDFTITSNYSLNRNINTNLDVISEENLCSICIDSLENDKILKLECNHIFHLECLKKVKNNKCPLCRANIVNDEYCLNNHQPVYFQTTYKKKNGMCSLCKKKSYSSYLNEMVIKQTTQIKEQQEPPTQNKNKTEKTETYSNLSNTINETFNIDIDTENTQLCKSIPKKKIS